MKQLDLKGRAVTAALSEMLSVLQLPKEGQRIERLLEFFAHSYFHANFNVAIPDFESILFPYRTVDACFVVVVATVMLNTDLHNPRISSKMTRTSFAAQLRRCNDDKNFLTVSPMPSSTPLARSHFPTSRASGRRMSTHKLMFQPC